MRDVVAWQKSRHLVYDTPITLTPTMTVGEALVLLHKRAHGAAIVTVGDRPVGIVTETDLTGVDRFTQLDDVMVRDMVTLEDGVDVESAFDTLSHARRRLAPVVARRRPAGRHPHPGRGAARAPLLARRSTTPAGCASPPRSASTATSPTKAKDLLDAGADVLVIDTAHGHQEKMIEALRAVRALDPGVPVVAGNVVSAAGHPRPHRGRCRHRQGRRRARARCARPG